MKTKIFLERNSHFADNEFLEMVAKVCELNAVQAEVRYAVKIDGSLKDEVYGATVEASSWDLLKIAEGLKNACANRKVVVPVILDNMPKGFAKAKYVSVDVLGKVSGAVTGVLGLAWDMQGMLRAAGIKNQLILDADLDNNLLSISGCSYPESNPDAWQKKISDFLHGCGENFKPVFCYVYAGEK